MPLKKFRLLIKKFFHRISREIEFFLIDKKAVDNQTERAYTIRNLNKDTNISYQEETSLEVRRIFIYHLENDEQYPKRIKNQCMQHM